MCLSLGVIHIGVWVKLNAFFPSTVGWGGGRGGGGEGRERKGGFFVNTFLFFYFCFSALLFISPSLYLIILFSVTVSFFSMYIYLSNLCTKRN